MSLLNAGAQYCQRERVHNRDFLLPKGREFMGVSCEGAFVVEYIRD